MSVGLFFKYDDSRVQAFFDYAGYKVRDQREPLEKVGSYLQHRVADALLTEGASIGEEWIPLMPRYAAWKEDHYPASERILQLKGHLYYEVINSENMRVTRDRLDWVIPLDYAVYHEEGMGNNPERHYFDVRSVEVDEHIENIYLNWLDELRRDNARRGAGPGLL